MHASSMYLPCGVGGACSGGMSCSNPVPPPGTRTKRLVMGVIRCDPGRKESAPFSGVHFSSGIQNPRADGGLVYWVGPPCESSRHP